MTRSTGRVREAWERASRAFGGRRTQRLAATREARFRLHYERFREILALNDSVLQLISEIEDRLAADAPFATERLQRRLRRAAMDVFVMVKNLNLVSGNRYPALYAALGRLNAELETELAGQRGGASGPLVVDLAQLRAGDARLVGSKMANLGEVAACCGFRVPDGFAVTTAAGVRFLTLGQLWERARKLESVLEEQGPRALEAACDELGRVIDACPIPEDMDQAMDEAFRTSFPERDARVAVRSSAVGEDAASASYAGLYATELRVSGLRFADAYRKVIASAFTPTAVTYRYERGLAPTDGLMAVGCVRMVEARCAGMLHSRPPDDPTGGETVISVAPGLAAALVAGEEPAETIRVDRSDIVAAGSDILSRDEIVELVAAGAAIEAHFGVPQDIEWAIDEKGRLYIIQARPLATLAARPPAPVQAPAVVRGASALLSSGMTACPGVDSGEVAHIDDGSRFETLPDGAVLVSRHSSPAFARAMTRCAALVTEVGAPTGHMASLAREFGVPTIVGAEGALKLLPQGLVVTVDANRCVVYEGEVMESSRVAAVAGEFGHSPAAATLQRLARLATPLSLTDPTGRDFRPENCRSLHDVIRFIHERSYDVMFHFGDMVQPDGQASRRLEARLPITLLVFDVGGGTQPRAEAQRSLRPDEVVSAPMRPFLDGLLDQRIRWDVPRPVSMRGFLSVLGESMAGPPTESLDVGRLSYAIVSDRYMNFSTKAGYHFSTLDTYCCDSLNTNYIHFRFSGGAADTARRQRRVSCLSKILTEIDFRVQVRGDILTGRLEKYDAAVITSRLASLGRLTLCARQLDMLMDSDDRPDYFADAFLAGEWEKF